MSYTIETPREAVAEACGWLNNWALPNVNDLAKHLEAVLAYAKTQNEFAWADPRIRDAEQALKQIKGAL